MDTIQNILLLIWIYLFLKQKELSLEFASVILPHL